MQAGTNQQAAGIAVEAYKALGSDTPDEATFRWVCARTAESMGVAVDDDSINKFLGVLTVGTQKPQELIVAALGGEMSTQQLFGILREELLALRLLQLGHVTDNWTGLSATPGERWEFFKKFNQKATIELALLSPEHYVNQIEKPSEATLKEFFEKHKDKESSPDSPTPGFKVPRKVNAEYLQADPSKYEDRVTEEEITQEYEKDPKKYARDLEQYEKDEKRDREDRAKDEKKEAEHKSGATKPEKKPEDEPKSGIEKPEAKTPAKPEIKSEAKPAEKKADTKPDQKPEPAKTVEPPKPAAPETSRPGARRSIRIHRSGL